MSPSWTFIDREAEGGAAARPVWDGGPNIPALVWEPFVPLRPESVTPVWTAGGAFNGIALSSTGTTGAYSIPTVPIAADDVVDARPASARSSRATTSAARSTSTIASGSVNERDSQFGSIWGRSRLSYAYKYWYSYEMTLGILNRSVERKGDPTIIVTFPQGSSRIGNQDVPNQTIAFDIGNKARSGSVLVVPSEVWGEDTGTSNQSPKWGITYLKAEETFDKLIAVLSYLDTMKIRSMMISELSAFEGSGGTSSRNVAAVTGERSYEAQIFTQTEWDEIINRYMIPQLADANFPELKDEPARKVTQAFGQDEAALAADILRSVANANPTNLPLDLPALLERFQIDALSGDDLAASGSADLVTKAETSTPPPAPAAPNGAAGTTDTGFYYDAPNRIELSTDDALLASLPDTKHYSDRAVLAQTRAVRKVWFDLLTAQYADFADHVSHVDLADDQARAEKIVGAWRYASAKTQAAVKKLSAALTTIFARAGAIELVGLEDRPQGLRPQRRDYGGLGQGQRRRHGALRRGHHARAAGHQAHPRPRARRQRRPDRQRPARALRRVPRLARRPDRARGDQALLQRGHAVRGRGGRHQAGAGARRPEGPDGRRVRAPQRAAVQHRRRLEGVGSRTRPGNPRMAHSSAEYSAIIALRLKGRDRRKRGSDRPRREHHPPRRGTRNPTLRASISTRWSAGS
jgi:hypothetical protein